MRSALLFTPDACRDIMTPIMPLGRVSSQVSLIYQTFTPNLQQEAIVENTGITWRNSIYTRILLTFLVILLPLYLLAYLAYAGAANTVRTGITESMASQAAFYLEGLELEIERIQYLQYGLINDTGLNRLAAIPESLDDIGRYEAIMNLQDRLDAMRNSSRYILNVAAHIPAVNRTVMAIGKIDTLDVARHKRLLDAYRPGENLQIVDDQVMLLIEAPFRLKENEASPMFLLEVTLDPGALSTALEQFGAHEGGGAFLHLRDRNRTLAVNGTVEPFMSKLVADAGMENRGTIAYRDPPVLAVYTYSQSLDILMGYVVPNRVAFQTLRQYSAWFFLFSGLAVLVVAIFTFSLHRWLRMPFQKLVKSFRQVEDGNLDTSLVHRFDDEFGFLYGRFNNMVGKIRTLIDQVYKSRILAQKAELKQLQSQINPHFLYNSFFILHRRIKGEDYENALAFSQKLGNYFRFITKNNSDEVPLAREVAHALVYVEIQQTRYAGRIEVCIEPLPETVRDLVVPYLILQPLLENAYEHGLKDTEADGRLAIRYALTDNLLHVFVEDNGIGIGDGELRHAAAGNREGCGAAGSYGPCEHPSASAPEVRRPGRSVF
jgi:two-component system, sensor histidine kinase YesM